MDSDLQFRQHNRYQFGDNNNNNNQQFQQHQQQQLQQPAMSGLTRYRSAPSSYFATLLDSTVNDDFLNQRPASPEMDRILARFIDSSNTHNSSSAANEAPQHPQFVESVKHEADMFQQHQNQQQNSSNYSSGGQIYQNQSQQQPLANCNEAPPNSGMDNSYSVVGSMAMDNRLPPPTKMGGGGANSNLLRQSSSPAGLFSSFINIEHGYGGMRGIENLRSVNVTDPEATLPSPSSLKRKFDYSSGAPPPPPSRKMASISENRSKSMDMSAFEDIGKEGGYIDGFAMGGAWDDSTMLSDSYMKTLDENDERKAFTGMNSSQNQRAESVNRPPAPLAHHLSLPTSSEELEKLLQFQDSVPLNVRAKRGCATHPRSIAERVRRNRISERMRKLQELVPNMDKQTNTSDMLDFAVDYIKELQKELKTLSDNRARCTCPK